MRPISEAQTPELALALPALKRARQRAEELAVATKTCIVEVRDGQLIRFRPPPSEPVAPERK